MLATRLLSENKPTLLSGTENGRDPFFSPDGQWIGFFADGKMKKISVQGGAAVTLCDAPGLRGGSFCTVTHGSRLRTRLYQVRWTEDVSVSGALERPQGRGGDVLARIDVVGPQGIAGRLRVRWREGVAEAHAVVRGSLGGKVVNATMSAP